MLAVWEGGMVVVVMVAGKARAVGEVALPWGLTIVANLRAVFLFHPTAILFLLQLQTLQPMPSASSFLQMLHHLLNFPTTIPLVCSRPPLSLITILLLFFPSLPVLVPRVVRVTNHRPAASHISMGRAGGVTHPPLTN